MRIVGKLLVLLLLLASVGLVTIPGPLLAQDSFTGGACLGAWGDVLDREATREQMKLYGLGSPGTPARTLRYWENGSPIGQGDYLPGADLQGMRMQMQPGGVNFVFMLAGMGPTFPLFVKMALDLSMAGADAPCLWCRVLGPFSPSPVYAQGQTNAFMGPGMREDVVLFAQVDGPGRATLQRVVGTATAGLSGTVQVSGSQVTMTIPFTVAVQLGLARPGVRLVFGAVGPSPKSVYSRIPQQGAIQIGLRGQLEVDPGPMVKEKSELAGRDVLYYLDTNGNGLIDAIARDRNGDGRLSFFRSEGPVLLLGTGLRPVEFSSVEAKTSGNQRLFLATSAAAYYLTIVQDSNNDGDVEDEGEFQSYLLPRQ